MIYELIRYLHIAAAVVGLGVLAVPLIAKKGGRVHVKVGWTWTIAMTVTAVSGMIIALFWLLDGSERRQSFALFLGFIGLFTLIALRRGISAVARKESPEARGGWSAIALPAIVVAAAIALGVFGVMRGSVLFMFFAVLGVLTAGSDIRFVRTPLPTRMSWWYEHMTGMLVATIAALTAFVVFNAQR